MAVIRKYWFVLFVAGVVLSTHATLYVMRSERTSERWDCVTDTPIVIRKSIRNSDDWNRLLIQHAAEGHCR